MNCFFWLDLPRQRFAIDHFSSQNMSGVLVIGLIYGLIHGVTYGLVYGLISSNSNISTTNSLDFSVKGIRRGLTYGLIYGLITGLVCGLIIGLTYGLVVGLESNKARDKTQPNEGMWNATKKFIFVSKISFSAGIIFFILPSLVVGKLVEWEKWILCGLGLGLSFSIYALVPLIQHGILRLLLWVNGSAPWNYAVFLDHANKLRLVQSVGGRYRFVHDLLREEMIDSMPLAHRLGRIPAWIHYPVVFAGCLVSISAQNGTEIVSRRFAQVAMPILASGDIVFFDRYSYRFTNPQHYELVTFRSENSNDISRIWIVGLPGETISSRDNQLLINGDPIDRPYTHFPPNFTIKKPFQVPAESYFVVGKAIDKNGKILPTGEVVHRKQITDRCVWRLWPLHRFGAIK